MNGKTYIAVVTIVYGSLLSSTESNTETNGLDEGRIFDVNFETNESSTREGYHGASPGFDNNIGPEPHNSKNVAVCSHTNIEYEPWWYVNIEDLYIIHQVVLYNRETYPGRLEGAQVRVGTSKHNLKNNTACGPPVSSNQSSVPAGNITLRCGPGTVGNIVSVQLENKTQYLTLCEVKLYGTIYTEYLTTVVIKETETTITSPSSTTTTKMKRSTSDTMDSYTSITTSALTTFSPETSSKGEHWNDNPWAQSKYYSGMLPEGESMEIKHNNLSGFVAKLYGNGTLHGRKLTNESDSVSVELQVNPNKDPDICFALIGKPKRYDDLTENAVTNGLDNDNSTQFKVGTDIFVSFIFDSNQSEITAGINIEFTYPKSQFYPELDEQPTCAFFNETLSYWSTKGCETEVDGSVVKCTCDHTTSYAILFQTSVSNDGISEKNKFALSVITYIGLTISTVFLLAALITQNLLPELRKLTRFKILTHLIIGAILSNIAFMTSELAQDQKILCYIYTGILHYSLLVVFVWMMIFSADLYAKVFYSFANHRKRMQWSKFVGWALPFFVVLISVAVTREEYIDSKLSPPYICWLNTKNGTVWAFIGPVILVVLINITLITRVLIEVSKKSRSANVTEKRKLDDLKYVAVRASLLLPVIGVTWVFGIMLLFDSKQVAIMYIFVITNTLQGALIWLTQFFWSREVKNAWTSMKKKRHYSLKKTNSRKKKQESNKEFNGIDEYAISPPNSTIDNTYSTTSKKSLTVSSDLTFATFTTRN